MFSGHFSNIQEIPIMITRATFAKVSTALILASQSAFTWAQGGITQVETTGAGVISTIDSIAPLVLLASIVIAGFLILMRMAGMAVIGSILGGGILIAGAPEIVTWFGI